MWVRSAFWVGRPESGAEEAFIKGIDTIIVPALRAIPGVQCAEALWPRRLEDRPPEIFCQILVRFASLSDIDAMMASPERLALRDKVIAVREIFNGSFSHIDYEVGDPDIASSSISSVAAGYRS